MSQPLPTILEDIIAEKHREIEVRQKSNPVELIENIIVEQNDVPRSFYQSLKRRIDNQQPAVIAEIKKASPSKGVIREDFDPVAIAKSYENAGAACLSVLTDEKFFQGSESYLDAAREATQLPVLRKDFIIDEYQVFEARAMGADCILLIAACLSHEQMFSLTRLAYDLGMDVLVEVHNVEELDKTAGLPIRMIGINNRNLHTFEVDLNTTFELSMLIPDNIMVISESGIVDSNAVRLLTSAGIYGFLVGESMMRHNDPGEKLTELFAVVTGDDSKDTVISDSLDNKSEVN
ncbi:MAG: indole-3-glycerol-phosphate synthase [Gammaproteobacteria bacterium]|nr:MAG: indole-3-glycerol-phosphate synthase [Gammaproteobacteria bacterium]